MPKTATKTKTDKTATTKKKRILWVEDEQALIDVYTEILEEIPGVDIEFMQLGQQAIDRMKDIQEGKAEKPDLIILDLLLPDVNGDKVCEVIRKTPATKNITVYVLTNYTGQEMEDKMTEELNAEKYLVKTQWGPVKLIPLLEKTLGLN